MYFVYFSFEVLGLSFWICSVFTLIFSVVVGLFMNNLIYRQLRNRGASNVILLIASFALLIFFESVVLMLFGADVKTLDYLKVQTGFQLFHAVVTPLQILIIASAFILFLVLLLFMKKSRLGKAMRAVSDNSEVAQIVGISPEKIYLWSFIIGSFIAGIAAILISLEQNLRPMIGTEIMVKSFAAAIIGGIGSVPGAILGSFLLGFSENYGIWFVDSGYKDAIGFGILLVFLIFRPRGILGIEKGLGD